LVRPNLGVHLAQTSIPWRTIWLDRQVLVDRGDFERILIHEIFHFAWVRLSNEARWEWEEILASEFRRRIRGELGWSAELRKLKLTMRDVTRRTPAWRRYICESFCDSAARMYSGLEHHDEFTLPSSAVKRRRKRLDQILATKGVRL
jgi:hypothetical protein